MAYQTPYFVIDENQLTKDFQMLKAPWKHPGAITGSDIPSKRIPCRGW